MPHVKTIHGRKNGEGQPRLIMIDEDQGGGYVWAIHKTTADGLQQVHSSGHTYYETEERATRAAYRALRNLAQ